MGRETKFGLLVGVVFIVLFGLILSSRAGLVAQEHASLPVGESAGHQRFAATDRRTDVPLVMAVPPVAEVSSPAGPAAPAEESLPVPVSFVPEEPAAAGPDDVGTVVFGPAEITTPSTDAPAPETLRDAPLKQPPPPAALTPRTVHKVDRGDTLTSIARRYFGKEGEGMWKKIHEANRQAIRDPNRLVVGQELVIPGLPAAPGPRTGPMPDAAPDTAIAAGAAPAAPAAPAPRVEPARDEVPAVTPDDLARLLGGQGDLVEQKAAAPSMYTVKPGENFYRIALAQYGDGRMARLLILKNKHLVPDEKKLKAGQRILLLDGVDAIPSDPVVAKR